MSIVATIAFGVLSSLVASVVFLFCISRLRPRIVISPYISFNDDQEGRFYVIKLLNKTKRPIINVRCRLNIVHPRSVPGGLIFNNKYVKLQREETFLIDRYDKKDKDANYAWRFVCREDLESQWEEGNGSYIIFRVIATDSLSGLSKYFSQRFFTKRDSFGKGSHRFGNDLAVE